MLCLLFNYTYFIWLEALTKLVNNTINIFLINANILLQHVFSSNIHEYR